MQEVVFVFGWSSRSLRTPLCELCTTLPRPPSPLGREIPSPDSPSPQRIPRQDVRSSFLKKYDHLATILFGLTRGVVDSGVRCMNEVNARRVRLVLGWVTVCGRVYHVGI